MVNTKRKYVNILVGVDIEDELELRNAGFKEYRRDNPNPQAPDEESQSTVELAIMLLVPSAVLKPAEDIPGARISSISVRDVMDQDPRLPDGVDWPS